MGIGPERRIQRRPGQLGLGELLRRYDDSRCVHGAVGHYRNREGRMEGLLPGHHNGLLWPRWPPIWHRHRVEDRRGNFRSDPPHDGRSGEYDNPPRCVRELVPQFFAIFLVACGKYRARRERAKVRKFIQLFYGIIQSLVKWESSYALSFRFAGVREITELCGGLIVR